MTVENWFQSLLTNHWFQSLLTNHWFQSLLSNSTCTATPGGDGSGGADGASGGGPDAEVGRDWNDLRIIERLAPLKDRRVIMISDMAGLKGCKR
jgi:hypothetical protein